jgi:hypothetical protein
MSATVTEIKSKYRVAKEVAEAEFIRMCEANRIDLDMSELPAEQIEKFTQLREDIIGDLRTGAIIVGEDGRPTYNLQGGVGLMFNPPTGATLIALQSKTNQVEGACLAMADMTKTDRSTFSKLGVRDYRACERLATLFLADV